MTKNAYLIQDGGDPLVWIDETMAGAILQAYRTYLKENCIEGEDDREHYESMLESCALIGEVGPQTWDEDRQWANPPSKGAPENSYNPEWDTKDQKNG